ncbi:MAG: hypothetical protein HY741_23825 [Chloroflexi bacterium]|nr:hypothetical protein [Chloroflexota bacterium]
MNQRSAILRLARKLARQNVRRYDARPTRPSQELDLAGEIENLHVRAIPPALWNELDALLDHNPSLGSAFARVLHAIVIHAHDTRLRAMADLALIRALNVCGEFQQALALCADAARRFEKRGDDAENVARVWLEAAWAHSYLGDFHTARSLLDRVDDAHGGEILLYKQWIDARLLCEQGEYRQAADQFAQLMAHWRAGGAPLHAARCQRERGHALPLRACLFLWRGLI